MINSIEKKIHFVQVIKMSIDYLWIMFDKKKECNAKRKETDGF
jgi:hypothetical protein